jgi:hypothetical protein
MVFQHEHCGANGIKRISPSLNCHRAGYGRPCGAQQKLCALIEQSGDFGAYNGAMGSGWRLAVKYYIDYI